MQTAVTSEWLQINSSGSPELERLLGWSEVTFRQLDSKTQQIDLYEHVFIEYEPIHSRRAVSVSSPEKHRRERVPLIQLLLGCFEAYISVFRCCCIKSFRSHSKQPQLGIGSVSEYIVAQSEPHGFVWLGSLKCSNLILRNLGRGSGQL